MKQRLHVIMLICLHSFFFIMTFCNTASAFTEDEKKLLKARHSFSIRIYPDLLTNLRLRNHQTTLKYVLIRLDLITETEKDMEAVTVHLPLLTDTMILFINKQTVQNFSSKKKENSVKDKLLVILNNSLFKEIKQKLITEIIFQNVMVE